MRFANLSLKTKVIVIALGLFLPAMAIGTTYFLFEVQRYAAKTAAGGLMNFVDAKQQGVIRFLGQNEKLAKSLLPLAASGDAATGKDAFRLFTRELVKNDVFKPEEHPFKEEIDSGKRHIPTFQTYRSIDLVENGTITASSDTAREGKPWDNTQDVTAGYSNVYLDDGKPTLLFKAEQAGKAVYIRADALMLTNITNGEIGNLEGDMGRYYLAGVGDTFDYYIVNKDNQMLTESRVYPDALLKQTGSTDPWKITQQTAGVNCNDAGVYQTNIGAVTGCREAMGYYDGIKGQQMLGVSMPFYDSEWTMVVEQEAAELFAPLNSLLMKVSLMGLVLAALASLLFVVMVNHYVFRPLAALFSQKHA